MGLEARVDAFPGGPKAHLAASSRGEGRAPVRGGAARSFWRISGKSTFLTSSAVPPSMPMELHSTSARIAALSTLARRERGRGEVRPIWVSPQHAQHLGQEGEREG